MANTIITKIEVDGEQQFAQDLNNASKSLDTYGKAQKIVEQETSKLTSKQLELRDAINSQAGVLKKLEETGKTQGKTYQQLSTQLKQNIADFEKETQSIKTNTNERKKLTLEQGNYRKVLDQVANGEINIREASKTLRQELIKLGLQGKQNTAQYLELKNVAGELADTVGDASAEISQAGSDTRGLDKALRATNTIVAGFGLAQAASALFGKENENLQKTLLKVNAVMLFMSFLQQIQEELKKKDTIFTGLQTGAQRIYAVAVGQSTGAMLLFRQALLGLGIGAIIAGIYLVVKAFQAWNKETNDAAKVNKILADSRKEATKNIESEIGELTRLTLIAKNENLTKQDRQNAIKQINENYPEYLGNIDLENIGTSTTNDLIYEQIGLLVKREQVKILTSKLAEQNLKKQRIIEGQELGAITKGRIAINKFFGFQ